MVPTGKKSWARGRFRPRWGCSVAPRGRELKQGKAFIFHPGLPGRRPRNAAEERDGLMKSLPALRRLMLAKGIGAMMKTRRTGGAGRRTPGLVRRAVVGRASDDLLGSQYRRRRQPQHRLRRAWRHAGAGSGRAHWLAGSAYGGPNSPQRGQAQGGLGGIPGQLGRAPPRAVWAAFWAASLWQRQWRKRWRRSDPVAAGTLAQKRLSARQ